MALLRQADLKEKARKHKDTMASVIQAVVRGLAARRMHLKRLPFLRKEQQLRKFCVECEVKVALRRCVQCKDRYCDDCYQNIHKKGYRRGHNWEPLGNNIGLRDEMPPEIDTSYGTNSGGGGGPPSSTRPGSKANATGGGGGGASATSQWQEFFDAGAQAKYWFNTNTGEATWVCPY